MPVLILRSSCFGQFREEPGGYFSREGIPDEFFPCGVHGAGGGYPAGDGYLAGRPVAAPGVVRLAGEREQGERRADHERGIPVGDEPDRDGGVSGNLAPAGGLLGGPVGGARETVAG